MKAKNIVQWRCIRVCFLVYMSPESFPPPTTEMVFLCNFTVRHIKPHRLGGSGRGSYGNGVASELMYYGKQPLAIIKHI